MKNHTTTISDREYTALEAAIALYNSEVGEHNPTPDEAEDLVVLNALADRLDTAGAKYTRTVHVPGDTAQPERGEMATVLRAHIIQMKQAGGDPAEVEQVMDNIGHGVTATRSFKEVVMLYVSLLGLMGRN